MGNSLYSSENRAVRSTNMGYTTRSRDEIFTQNVEKKIHAEMNPKGVVIRECRDSELHPNTVPIQVYLDVTGSMGMIPHEMIKDGLPTMMGTIIQAGVPDAAVMFGAIGDHECDKAPLQIGQFESGDAELDMWLTRTWLEGNGGGNAGESYLLAWYFAANHISTDAWEKRGKKGFVFTIGDEPCLKNLPLSAVKEIMGDSAAGQATISRDELLAEAQRTNHVYHIQVDHGGRSAAPSWKEMLGENLITITDYRNVAKVIADIILKVSANYETPVQSQPQAQAKPEASVNESDSQTEDML